MIRRPYALLLGLTLLALGGCSIQRQVIEQNRSTSPIAISPTLGGKLYTSAWIQRSAEYKALCLQAYALAKLRLDEALAQHQAGRPLAVVTDIDETILDNSPNSVHQALKGEDYTDEAWNEWCARAEAEVMAGAQAFFAYAAERGVKVYYISNRFEANRQGTLANLRKHNFPYAQDEHLLLRTTTSDKTERRAQVAMGHEIVLLLGDNLGDFDHLFDAADERKRDEALWDMQAEFGRRFIVLPNPNYGTWDKAMHGGYPPLAERDDRLRTILKSY